MKLFEFIRKALSEDNGNPSSSRFNTFFALLQWSPAITIGFFVVLIHYENLILPYLQTLSALTAAILGIGVWRKTTEEKVITPVPPKSQVESQQ